MRLAITDIGPRLAADATSMYRFQAFVQSAFKEIINFSNRRIGLRDNCRSEYVEVTTPAANTEFTVAHSLDVVPFMWVGNLDVAGDLYDSNRASWTKTAIKLKCTAAGAAARILILG